jgi:hypothetical protein
MNVPVVLLVYKRPQLTQLLVETLRAARVKKIFVFADGPASAHDEPLCTQTKNIINTIDWTHDVYTEFSPTNMGLGNRVVSGLNHVFSQVEQAIVLEDDCIPHPDFWSFCQTMLRYYKEDNAIMHISGTNVVHRHTASLPSSYFFSRHALPCWGWATWARAWKNFNPQYKTWQQHKQQLRQLITEQNYHTCNAVFDTLAKGNIDSWDVQWMIDIWQHHGTVVVPKNNLIANLGNGEGSSYMPQLSQFANMHTHAISTQLIHPPQIEYPFDKLYEDQIVELMKEFMAHNKLKSLSNIKPPVWLKQ